MLKRILLPLVVAVLASATLPAQSAGTLDINRPSAAAGTALDTVSAVDSSGTFVLERVARPHTYRPGREDKTLQEVPRADTRKNTASPAAAGQALRSTPRIMTGYAVGAIPMSSDVTASGARVYSIPIATAAGWNFVPSLSLQYSSQGGAGEAGAGWTVGGLGAVTQRARNTYYDGYAGPVDIDATDAVYALDGVPLVRCSVQTLYDAGYTLETVTGNTFVKPVFDGLGRATHFTALYPDGSSAAFSVPSGPSVDCIYPVTSRADAFGNRILFEYEPDGGMQHIKRVRYGTDLSASVVFTYGSASVPRTGYVSGRERTGRRLIKSIASLDGTDTVCRYSLYHEDRYDTDLLKRVDCSREGSSLPPVEFSYGMAAIHGYEPMEDYNLYSLPGGDVPVFFDNSRYRVLYSRGRMLPDTNPMGLISLPFFQPDTVVQKRLGRKRYGSSCHPDQKIIVAPTLGTGYAVVTVDTTLTAGEGLQDIQAADIDGDGRDEVVKVNTAVIGDGTRVTYGIYSYAGTYYNPSRTYDSYSVTFPGTRTDGSLVSPLPVVSFLGDFTGDGRCQVMSVDALSGVVRVSDLKTKSLVCGGYAFVPQTSWGRSVDAAAMDIDGDGVSELCRFTESGVEVWRCTGGGLTRSFTAPGISPEQWGRRVAVGDVNGDGYTDIAWAGSRQDSITFSAFTGREFNELYTIAARTDSAQCVLADLNSDGTDELVRVRKGTLYTHLNNGGHIAGWPDVVMDVEYWSDIAPGNIVNRSADCLTLIDSHRIWRYRYGSDRTMMRLVSTVEDSYGVVQNNIYEDICDIDALSYHTAQDPAYTLEDGYCRRTFPFKVLTETSTYSAESPETAPVDFRSYLYYDAVVHTHGLGFCGFGKVIEHDWTASPNIYVRRWYDPVNSGVPVRETMSLNSNGSAPYASVTSSWGRVTKPYARRRPRLNGTTTRDSLTGRTVTETFFYGDLDLANYHTTVTSIPGYTTHYRYENYTYNNALTSSKCFIGRPAAVISTEVEGTTPMSTRMEFTYAGPLGPLMGLRTYVGESSSQYGLLSEKILVHDSRGNVTSEQESRYGSPARVTTSYAYDINGRHLTSSTDALGHTTSYSGYDIFGNPSEVTDFMGRVTRNLYDVWGTEVSVRRPDGSRDTVVTAWGGAGLYTVTSSSNAGPTTMEHFNSLQRTVRSEAERFDGTMLRTDTRYDARGRVSSVSQPYKEDSPSRWTSYTYDGYGRRTSVTEPSGRTTTTSYSGASVTTVEDGVTSITYYDASGRPARVTDAGGQVTFAYRPDGRLASVTAPGGAVTSFAYDIYGRTTSVSDPSLGHRTYSYVDYNAGGCRVRATGPNGTVITVSDILGRTLSVTRQGEGDSEYIYDDDGRLTEVTDSDGALRRYTYDALDRISTVRDSTADGKWLTQTFAYDSDGRQSATTFTTWSGSVLGETYAYAHGTHCMTETGDGTVIWRLDAENSMGLPTAATTGSVTRTYTYTAAGIPSGRAAAGLQNSTFTTDAARGNMTSRADAVRGTTEAFSYDAMNRLVNAGSTTMSYASNGNIVSNSDVGQFIYDDATCPYLLTGATRGGTPVDVRPYGITFNAWDLPAGITEGGIETTFAFSPLGDRSRMTVKENGTTVLTRHYLGDRYECDEAPGEDTVERLYMDGDAYDAPMVYERRGSGQWQLLNIVRDNLGSVTHVATAGGTLLAEYSYDAWGRLRDPQTLVPYARGQEPALRLGRGYTGHEHLQQHGIVHMNARLYDPVTGRFLGPDPVMPEAGLTQTYNSYTYCLNNPLKYTDPTGEFIGTIFTTLFQFPIAFVKGIVAPYFVGFMDTLKAGQMCGDAWTEYGEKVSNAFKIDMGLLKTDSNQSLAENAWTIASRFTWERKSTLIGNIYSHVRNIFNNADESVDINYYHGATLVNNHSSDGKWGLTLGSYINGSNLVADSAVSDVFAHEYGHTKQSKILGPAYMSVVGLPSFIGAGLTYVSSHNHGNEWYEVWSNNLTQNYHDSHGYKLAPEFDKRPRKQKPDWYYYATLAYYGSPFSLSLLLFLL